MKHSRMRTDSKAVPLMEQGTEAANTVTEAIAASPVVVICVLD
nr:hypothetical protein [Paenibacillus terrae]